MNLSEVLSQALCFSKLTVAEIRALLAGMEVVHFQRNQPLWREGEVSSRVGILTAGKVKLVQHREKGQDLIVDLPVTGSLLGLGAGACAPQAAGVIGLAQGAMVMFEREHLLAVLGPRRLVALLSEQDDRSDRLYFHLLKKSSAGDDQTRLATLLLRMAITDGELSEDGVQVTLPLSRQDLASLIDAPLASVIRLLSRWNHERLVLTTRSGLLIPSLNRLMARASFNDDPDPVPMPPVGSICSSGSRDSSEAMHAGH